VVVIYLSAFALDNLFEIFIFLPLE
jgi:hypothetical protein